MSDAELDLLLEQHLKCVICMNVQHGASNDARTAYEALRNFVSQAGLSASPRVQGAGGLPSGNMISDPENAGNDECAEMSCLS